MKSVVHAGCQAQCHVGAIFQGFNQLASSGREAHQAGKAVWEAFGLKDLGVINVATFAHNGITGAAKDFIAHVNGPRTWFKFANKAIVHAVKFGF